ncbi:unnamed protein product [Meganyctiphanes norvegica]|uniref:protein xylosyltransferase n=1 Tax=Meganyctiphanes norvegica TaxID=48144 RepID=A0AAV2R3G9_MEGNR
MVVAARAIFIVTLNILRVIFRKYKIYVILGLLIVSFQVFSGYYIFSIGSDKSLQESFLESENARLEREENTNLAIKRVDKESIDYENSDLQDTIKHIKKPESLSNVDEDKLENDELATLKLSCRVRSREALSAIQRAKTEDCKREIGNISCQVQAGSFYPSRLKSYCPSNGNVRGRAMGCFVDSRDKRILRGHGMQLKHNTPALCVDVCFQRGYMFAGVQYGKECFCGNDELPEHDNVPEGDCSMDCVGDNKIKCGGYLRISIYQTGLAKYVPKPLKKPGFGSRPARIAYILTVNGRAARQILRLFKALYHIDHYFYIHVDSRQDYLFREMQELEKRFSNVHVSTIRRSTIWGGASLLKILLHCMESILNIKDWHWDYIINLSESDYPIKTNEELVGFLSSNHQRNFLKSHGHDTNRFIQKQGLDRSFHECENHMWRIGERKLPLGIRMDGGSDWLCLNRKFVEYVVTSTDQLVMGLKKVYSYTLLPAESFFHTILRNSEFCETFTDNNLHVTNWKRKLGCKCQYKHIVDWCGCSPNDFKLEDWPKLEGSSPRSLFFARKFEAIVGQKIIHKVEEKLLYGPYYPETPGLDYYWENRYHHLDKPLSTIDTDLTLYNSAARLATKQLEELHGECKMTATAILQTEALMYDDEFKGLIIEFAASVTGITGIKIQTFLSPSVKFKFYSLDDDSLGNHKLEGIEIGSNFDVKEQIFRSFGLPLGPESDIIVVTKWHDTETKEDKKHKSQNEKVEDDKEETNEVSTAQLILTDPRDKAAALQEITLESGDQILSETFKLVKPLYPGIWKVHVVQNHKVIASHSFLVLPMQFVQGREIKIKESRQLHKGPEESYQQIDLHSICKDLDKYNIGNFSAMNLASEHGSYFGQQLKQWIDSLVTSFYDIQDNCYIPSSSYDFPKSLSGMLKECPHTSWSSYSPDPKSDLGVIDHVSGKMSEPYRMLRKHV